MMTRPILLKGLSRLVLLQIRKIATILRQAEALQNLDESRSQLAEALSRRLDHVAIGPARHHAILQLAGGGQIACEPETDRKQHDGDHEACDGARAAVGLVVLFRIALRIVLEIVFGISGIRHSRGCPVDAASASTTTARAALRLPHADGLDRPMMSHRLNMADPMTGRHDAGRAVALPVGAKRGARHRRRIGKANGNRNRSAGQQ